MTNKTSIFILFILFYVGWIKFPFTGDAVYLADYFFRVLMLILIWQERAVLFTSPNWPKIRLWLLFPVSFIGLIFLNKILSSFDFMIEIDSYFFKAAQYPPIENIYLLAFDMTLGLMMVAVTEEFFFRYKLDALLRANTKTVIF